MGKIKLISRRVFCKFLIGILFAPRLYARQNQPLQIAQGRKQLIQKEGNDILVLYYSLSGKTEIMAKAIASRYQADLIEIEAEEYSNDFIGSTRASAAAWTEERNSTIDPKIIDLNRYRFIFLGSPIWWYRPAVPLWTFVVKNNFQSQNIVLFNTFNSRFKDKHIDEFSDLVRSKGGNLDDHIFIRRGRWYNQLDQNELVEKIQTLIKSKETQWDFRPGLDLNQDRNQKRGGAATTWSNKRAAMSLDTRFTLS
jgi:flavodoxin